MYNINGRSDLSKVFFTHKNLASNYILTERFARIAAKVNYSFAETNNTEYADIFRLHNIIWTRVSFINYDKYLNLQQTSLEDSTP